MALIDKETIRKEIQRLEQNILSKVHHYPIHRIELLNDLLAFLDSLPEQPVIDHREIELEFRGEKVKFRRNFYRDTEGHEWSTSEQDDDALWACLRAWCDKKDYSLFDLYPRGVVLEADLNFEKEVDKTVNECTNGYDFDWEKFARHFYELGQQSRPKISYNPLELEQEILSYIRWMGFGYGGWVDGLEDEDLCKLARHFAEWGAKNAK